VSPALPAAASPEMRIIGRHRLTGAVALAAALVVVQGPGGASAREYQAGTAAALAAALAAAEDAPGPDTIRLAPGVYLPGQTLELRGSLTIEGPATAPGARLDGGSVEPYPAPLLSVARGANVTLRDVLASTGGGGAQGAVEVLGSARIEASAIIGSNGPGLTVADGGRAVVENTTISDGGGAGIVSDGRADLLNVSVAGNAGGGIDGQGAVQLSNTLVTGNAFGDCATPVVESRSSLDGDGTCGVGALSGRGTALGPAALNGGPTPTRALLPGSAAIGAGDPAACPLADQRGYARARGACDIGAFAISATAPVRSASPQTAASRPRSISADGRLRTAKRSAVRVRLQAREGTAAAVVRITDAARRLDVRATRVASLRFRSHPTIVAVRGSGTDRRTGRRVAFTLSLHIGRRSWGRVTLAGRPAARGRLRVVRLTSMPL